MMLHSPIASLMDEISQPLRLTSRSLGALVGCGSVLGFDVTRSRRRIFTGSHKTGTVELRVRFP